MIVVENVALAEDILEKHFVCDLKRCKGACCEEGDSGAPLTAAEVEKITEIYEQVAPFLTERGIAELTKQGLYLEEKDGEYLTPLVSGRECVYAVKDKKTSTWQCGFEKAYLAGATDFRKPMSCHLYPIRAIDYPEWHLLNYHKWYVCNDACALGEQLGVELYRFLKEPLIRKFGEAWYAELEQVAAEYRKSKA